MKPKTIITALLALIAMSATAQVTKSVSILGDSYSTFDGFVTPSTNEMWYYEETATPPT